MSIQVKGELPDQRTAEFFDVHGPGQVQNNEGGLVNKLNDMDRLKRFVIAGCDGTLYYVNNHDQLSKNIDCIDRIIRDGKGPQAVDVIKTISKQRRNLSPQYLLYALAILARSIDEETKKAAYEALTDICRIPTHLFLFIKFCEEASSRGNGGTGWGRAHRRAISSWYTSFAQNPEELARLVSKYKRREKTSHIDVLRLAHPNCDKIPVPVAFILTYIVKNLNDANQKYANNLDTDQEMRRAAEFLRVCDSAMTTNQPDHLCHLITEHRLSREHCPTGMLNNQKVWCALLPHMNVEALIRNLNKMSQLGLFETNSQEEETAVNKINSINEECEVQESEEEAEMDQELSWQPVSRRHKNILHPYQVLIGWMTYKKGEGDRGKKQWTPNDKIVKALEEAFYKAFETMESTGKKFFLAVHMSGNMTQPALRRSFGGCSFDYTNAAATMLMSTVRCEENVIVKGFSHEIFDLHIAPSDDLDTVIKKSFPAPHGGADCALPMKYAVENKMRDIDVFVIYTDSETVDGNVHVTEAFRQYQEFSSNPGVKLIVCGMCATTEFTLTDPDDFNMLNIVGFDAAAPRLMSQFVQGL